MTTKQRRRKSLPAFWLMTDERLGGHAASDPLWRAIANLPPGAGIVFRHYHLPVPDRMKLLQHVQRVAAERRLIVVGSGVEADGGRHFPSACLGAASLGPARRRLPDKRRLVTASVHNRMELRAALRFGVDLVFISPVFSTRSHPGSPGLGPAGFARLAMASPVPVIALGGMTAKRFHRLQRLGAYGFAAIDWWLNPAVVVRTPVQRGRGRFGPKGR